MSEEAGSATQVASPRPACAFAVGDAVVAPRHGVGTVVERGVRRLAGAQREYLTIEVERRRMRLLIPTESANGERLRPLSSPSEARQALSVLGSPPQRLGENWRDRQKEVGQRLAEGQLVAVAELVRDFACAAQPKRLAGKDHQAYTTALELLESEIRAALGWSAERAAAEIEGRLPESPACQSDGD